VATYALIHGGAHGGSCWHLLVDELEARGHDVVAPDLPIDDDAADLEAHIRAVVDAVADRNNVVVVAHSLGGLVGPLVCPRVDANLLVLLAAMVPAPGESCFELWENTGYGVPIEGAERLREDPGSVTTQGHGDVLPEAAAIAAFYHDVPRDVALDAVSMLRNQSLTVFSEPSPMTAWPDVPTSYILCRDDRAVPPAWSRRVVQDRLGITPEEIDGGHSPFLSRPAELAELLESLRVGVGIAS
jgi:pimeloyl-ACP methyl ester carboxylesterase